MLRNIFLFLFIVHASSSLMAMEAPPDETAQNDKKPNRLIDSECADLPTSSTNHDLPRRKIKSCRYSIFNNSCDGDLPRKIKSSEHHYSLFEDSDDDNENLPEKIRFVFKNLTGETIKLRGRFGPMYTVTNIDGELKRVEALPLGFFCKPGIPDEPEIVTLRDGEMIEFFLRMAKMPLRARVFPADYTPDKDVDVYGRPTKTSQRNFDNSSGFILPLDRINLMERSAFVTFQKDVTGEKRYTCSTRDLTNEDVGDASLVKGHVIHYGIICGNNG